MTNKEKAQRLLLQGNHVYNQCWLEHINIIIDLLKESEETKEELRHTIRQCFLSGFLISRSNNPKYEKILNLAIKQLEEEVEKFYSNDNS